MDKCITNWTHELHSGKYHGSISRKTLNSKQLQMEDDRWRKKDFYIYVYDQIMCILSFPILYQQRINRTRLGVNSRSVSQKIVPAPPSLRQCTEDSLSGLPGWRAAREQSDRLRPAGHDLKTLKLLMGKVELQIPTNNRAGKMTDVMIPRLKVFRPRP